MRPFVAEKFPPSAFIGVHLRSNARCPCGSTLVSFSVILRILRTNLPFPLRPSAGPMACRQVVGGRRQNLPHTRQLLPCDRLLAAGLAVDDTIVPFRLPAAVTGFAVAVQQRSLPQN